MTDRDHSRCTAEDVREALQQEVRPAATSQGKRQSTGADVARTAMHILEVQGADAVKDFLTRTIELDAARKSFTGNT